MVNFQLVAKVVYLMELGLRQSIIGDHVNFFTYKVMRQQLLI